MPLEVFLSYSHKDARLREQLGVHLTQLVRDGLILPWTDRAIAPGDEWRTQIDTHIRSAHIILLLISSDFIASDYCYGEEMRIALERHAHEQTVVVPILLRPVDWHSAPFAHLQCLPREARPVTTWTNRDLAFQQIATSLRELVVRLQKPTAGTAAPAAIEDQLVPQPRVVDAAMPSHIIKDRATELLVLIRLPESRGLAGVLQNDQEAEARPEDVRSRPFDVIFPLSPTGRPEALKITVQLTSPDFDPPGNKKNIFIPVSRDSDVCPFVLTPKKTGALLVVIELLWEDAERGYRRLKTTCVADAEPAPAGMTPAGMVLVQMPLAAQTAAKKAATAAAAYAPAPSMTSALPPIQEEANYLPTSTPAPTNASRPKSSASWMSGSAVKVGMALCVLTVGSTFFLFKNPSAPGGTYPAPSAPPPVSMSVLQQNIDVRSAELQELTPATATPKPALAAILKTSRANLVAARQALAKGDRVAAQKHLAAVKAANARLRELEKSP